MKNKIIRRTINLLNFLSMINKVEHEYVLEYFEPLLNLIDLDSLNVSSLLFFMSPICTVVFMQVHLYFK